MSKIFILLLNSNYENFMYQCYWNCKVKKSCEDSKCFENCIKNRERLKIFKIWYSDWYSKKYRNCEKCLF